MKKRTTPRRRGAEQRVAATDTAGHLAAVTVKDFKSLKNVSVELGQVNVFVGANRAGKSCLSRAIGILGARSAGAVERNATPRQASRVTP